MQTLTDGLYVISSALLLPVVIVLLALLAWTLCLLGGFLRELGERNQVRQTLAASLAAARRGEPPEMVWRELGQARAGLPRRFVRLTGTAGGERTPTAALAELEHDITAAIARHSFLTRVGPMLGLMGTLIPLGPALTGLAAGNVQVLASNLVVAFTTTVVGLLVSALAYGMALARRTWYARDFSDLESLCHQVTHPGK